MQSVIFRRRQMNGNRRNCVHTRARARAFASTRRHVNAEIESARSKMSPTDWSRRSDVTDAGRVSGRKSSSIGKLVAIQERVEASKFNGSDREAEIKINESASGKTRKAETYKSSEADQRKSSREVYCTRGRAARREMERKRNGWSERRREKAEERERERERERR